MMMLTEKIRGLRRWRCVPALLVLAALPAAAQAGAPPADRPGAQATEDEPAVPDGPPSNADEMSGADRLASDPEFVPPPPIPDAVEGGERVRFLHPSGGVAREGWLVAGKRSGVWKSYAPNGDLLEHGAYDDYDRVGPWVLRSDDGGLVRGHFDRSGRRTGIWVQLDPVSLHLRSRVEWYQGQRHGSVERFDPVTGRLIVRVHYRKGRQHGATQRFDRRTGLAVEIGEYARDVESGTWRYYYGNGVLKAMGGFALGLQDGEWTEYHESGVKRLVGSFEGGRRVGEWRGYHKKGERHSISHFVDGLPHGEYLEWWPSGEKRAEGEYVDGLQEGKWTFWNRDGTIDPKGSGTYRQGVIVR